MVISVPLLLSLMLCHWIADFVLQSNKMATLKSADNWWLSYHVLVYTTFMGMFASLWLTSINAVVWTSVNGILHWITDYYTSKQSSKLFKRNDYHYAFVVIGFDQFIHFTCILLTTWALL